MLPRWSHISFALLELDILLAVVIFGNTIIASCYPNYCFSGQIVSKTKAFKHTQFPVLPTSGTQF
jgi:hypothetical protein